MNNYIKFISMRAGNFSIALFIVMLCVSISAMAQGDGPRFYWKGLMGTNAIPVIGKFHGWKCKPVWILLILLFPDADFKATMSYGWLCQDAACGQTFGIGFGNCSHGQNIR